MTDELDKTNIDAMYWANKYSEIVPETDVDFLMVYFANYRFAVSDPLDKEIARLRAEAEENKVVLDLCGNTERHLRDKAAGLFMEGEKKDGQIAALTAQLDQAKVLLEDTSCGQRHIGAESCPHCDGLIDELIEAISND